MSADTEAGVNGIGVRLSVEAMLGKLGDGIDAAVQGLDRLHKMLEANQVRSPLARKLNKTITAAATALTYTFVDMGAPNNGSVWDVRRVSISGPDPFTVLSGVLVLSFIAQQAPSDSNTEPPAFLDLVENGNPAPVPNIAFYPRDQVTLLPGEHLIFCLKGLANNQVIMASMQVEQWREDDKAAVTYAP